MWDHTKAPLAPGPPALTGFERGLAYECETLGPSNAASSRSRTRLRPSAHRKWDDPSVEKVAASKDFELELRGLAIVAQIEEEFGTTRMEWVADWAKGLAKEQQQLPLWHDAELLLHFAAISRRDGMVPHQGT